MIADHIPDTARASAVKFLTASATEEAKDIDKEISTAKEELVKQRVGSLLEIPRDLAPLCSLIFQ